MRVSSAAAISSLVAAAVAAPFSFPLPNGFPNLSQKALAAVEAKAGGTLPNTPLPKTLSAAAVTDLQVIATGETFEVAYFTSLLRNVTNNVKGYTSLDNKTQTVEILQAIRAQEELHAYGANAILKSAGHPEVQPCKYNFPVDNYLDAIALANTFTDAVLGALQSVQQQFALDGGAEASGLVPLVGSIIGQEGEQNGLYRLLQKKVPSSAPFLTNTAGEFVYNAIAQNFVVPGSCPSASSIDVPAYKPLTVAKMPPAKNSTVSYGTTATGVTADAYSIAYTSGQNYPVVVPISAVSTKGGETTFTADFPYDGGFSRGLTVGALVKGKGPFTSSGAVAKSAVAGPALIEVN